MLKSTLSGWYTPNQICFPIHSPNRFRWHTHNPLMNMTSICHGFGNIQWSLFQRRDTNRNTKLKLTFNADESIIFQTTVLLSYFKGEITETRNWYALNSNCWFVFEFYKKSNSFSYQSKNSQWDKYPPNLKRSGCNDEKTLYHMVSYKKPLHEKMKHSKNNGIIYKTIYEKQNLIWLPEPTTLTGK